MREETLSGGMYRFASRLPELEWSHFLTLGEGDTPLVESRWINKELGLRRLYFKLEQCNPSGSYKDRFVACELALQKRRGVRRVFATSSGNTGAALAAYCARHALQCHIFVLEATPEGKLVQMAAHGAFIHRVRNFGTSPAVTQEIFDRLSRLSKAGEGALIISAFRYCPVGMQGVKTIAYEIAEQLGRVPDHTFVPVGGGGLYSAVAEGYLDLAGDDQKSAGSAHIVQPRLNDTVVTALREGRESAEPVATVTRISGLGVPVDIDGTRAMTLARRVGGTGFLPTDEAILRAQQDLLQREGLFVEPAGAASVAGLMEAVATELIDPDDSVVCLLSGHGFKDVNSLTSRLSPPGLIDADEISKRLLREHS